MAYGSAWLKTHTKTALVVRREPDGIRRYVHIGSGNYNSRTARPYTDVGLFTCSPSIGADVSDLFNSLTGISRQRLYRKLLVAPANMHERFLELIEREMNLAMNGGSGRIVAKMNSLVDATVIDALYRASQAGVEIDLIVRGICCLRPGMRGVSERIRVRAAITIPRTFARGIRQPGADEFYPVPPIGCAQFSASCRAVLNGGTDSRNNLRSLLRFVSRTTGKRGAGRGGQLDAARF